MVHPGSGATGRNGGHLTPNPFNGFAKRESAYGPEDSKKTYIIEDYVSRSIVDIIQSHGWTEVVDLVKGDHITLFYTEEVARVALEDFERAKKSGLDLNDVKFLNRQTMFEVCAIFSGIHISLLTFAPYQTYGVNYSGVLFPSHNLWPLKFASGLYNISSGSTNVPFKLKLHTFTPVTSVHPSSPSPARGLKKWILTTPRGALTCKNVIHATNAYASYLLPHFQDRIIPTRGQVVALRANSSLERLQRHSWSAIGGNEYWFPRPEEKDGEGCKPPLVIFGGGRDEAGPGSEQYTTDDSVLNENVGKILRGFLPDLFAGTGMFEEGREPEMEWVSSTPKSHTDGWFDF